ncbi:iron-siderophore ABC transporter substrate-binding protein [soil metagenome]
MNSLSALIHRRTFVGVVAATAGFAFAPKAFAFQATPTAALKLMPSPPAELGAPETPPATVSTAEDADAFDKVMAPYEGFGTDAAPGVFPRTIRHAMGEVTLESAPVKVVTLDVGELDAVLLMGVVPVGAVEYTGTSWADFIAEQAQEIVIVGTLEEPDFEAIAALNPDVIISSKLRHEAIYEQLNRIAPTMFSERPGVAFRHNFALYAQTLGREVEAAAVVERYEARVKELNAALPAERPVTAVVQLRTDHVRFYQRSNFIGLVLADLGIPRCEIENVDDFAAVVSNEQLNEIADSELIFVAVQSQEDNPYAEEILAAPLWQSLPAVAAGNLVTVDNAIWIAGVGYGSAFEVLDDIAEHFGV